jgi:hypothetical protein
VCEETDIPRITGASRIVATLINNASFISIDSLSAVATKVLKLVSRESTELYAVR